MEVRAEPWATGSHMAPSGAASLTQALEGQPLPRVGGTLGPAPSLQEPPPHTWPLWPSWPAEGEPAPRSSGLRLSAEPGDLPPAP